MNGETPTSSPSTAPPRIVDAVKKAELQHRMLAHSGLVHNIAWKLSRRWRPHAEREDLVQAGYIGLAEAHSRYDPSQAKFITFAYERVAGAMKDYMRRQPWYRHRSLAEQTRDMADEVLAETTIDVNESDSTEDEWARSSVRRLATVCWIGSAVGHGVFDAATDSDARPDEIRARQEMIELVRECIDELPAEEGELLRMTYFEGLTLQEAGERLGMRKWTASRRHAKILDKLAARLRGEIAIERSD